MLDETLDYYHANCTWLYCKSEIFFNKADKWTRIKKSLWVQP